MFAHEKKDAFVYAGKSIQLQHQAFTFDRVFSPAASTREVYEKIGRPIIQQIVQGYNGTVIAYGQTTSGKTYTMSGGSNSPGLIGHAAHELFGLLAAADCTVTASYLEIYNEVVCDLLQASASHLKIREDPAEGCFVPGLKRIPVRTPEEVLDVLALGEKFRRYRTTNIHEHSSRSHTVFQVVVESKLPSGSLTVSVLNFVELCVSERLSYASRKQANSRRAYSCWPTWSTN